MELLYQHQHKQVCEAQKTAGWYQKSKTNEVGNFESERSELENNSIRNINPQRKKTRSVQYQVEREQLM